MKRTTLVLLVTAVIFSGCSNREELREAARNKPFLTSTKVSSNQMSVADRKRLNLNALAFLRSPDFDKSTRSLRTVNALISIANQDQFTYRVLTEFDSNFRAAKTTYPNNKREWKRAFVQGTQTLYGKYVDQQRVLINPYFSDRSSELFVSLHEFTADVSDTTLNTLSKIFGRSIRTEDLKIGVVPERSPWKEKAGLTIGTVAVASERSAKRNARLFDSTLQETLHSIVANEGMHQILNRQKPLLGEKQWDIKALQENLSIRFKLRQRHLREFLSDVTTIHENSVGVKMTLLNLADGALKVDEDWQPVPNDNHPYVLTGDTLLKVVKKFINENPDTPDHKFLSSLPVWASERKVKELLNAMPDQFDPDFLSLLRTTMMDNAIEIMRHHL